MYRLLLRQAARFKAKLTLHRRCFASEQGPKLGPSTGNPAPSATVRRLDRWIARSPGFFQPSLLALRNAPASSIASFAILHEFTAVIPLFGLAYVFHYFRWLPPYFAEGKWAIQGVEKFGKWFKKKGWIDDQGEKQVETEAKIERAWIFEDKNMSDASNKSENAARWLVEFATAYAIVKALLPLRIVLSVWGAPAFARLTVIPIGNAVRATFRSRSGGRR